jgi:hypothetical protein
LIVIVILEWEIYYCWEKKKEINMYKRESQEKKYKCGLFIILIASGGSFLQKNRKLLLFAFVHKTYRIP